MSSLYSSRSMFSNGEAAGGAKGARESSDLAPRSTVSGTKVEWVEPSALVRSWGANARSTRLLGSVVFVGPGPELPSAPSRLTDG